MAVRLIGSQDVPLAPSPRGGGVPQIPNVSQAGATNFGTGLTQLGHELSTEQALAEARVQKRTDANATTTAELAFSDALSTEFADRQVKGDPTSDTFASDIHTWAEERARDTIKSLPGNVSQDAADALSRRLAAKVIATKDAAYKVQLEAGKAQSIDLIGQGINRIARDAQANPDAIDGWLAEADQTISPYRGTMDQNTERDQATNARRRVIESAAAGLVANHRYDDAKKLLGRDDLIKDLGEAAQTRILAGVEQGKRVAAAEIRDQATDHFASIAATGQGIPGLDAKAARVLDPEQLAAFRTSQARAFKVHDIAENIKFAPPEDMAQQIDRLKPKPGSTTFADDQRTYDALITQGQRLLKARTDNPAGYAMQMPQVAAAYEEARKNPALVPNAVTTSLAAQDAMGVPKEAQKVLPNAKAEVARIEALPPEQAANEIEGMATQYGKYWGQAYRELVGEKLSPSYMALGTLDGPGDARTRKDLAGALQAGQKTLVDSLPASTPKSDLDKSVGTAMEEWSRLELARGGTERNVAAMRSSAELLTYKYAAEGDPNPAQRAVKALITDRYDLLTTSNFQMYVPKGSQRAVEDTGLKLLNGLTAENMPDPGGDPALTEAQRRAEYLKQAKRGRFVLSPDGTGAYLLDSQGQPVVSNGTSAIMLQTRPGGPYVPVIGFYLNDAKVDTEGVEPGFFQPNVSPPRESIYRGMIPSPFK